MARLHSPISCLDPRLARRDFLHLGGLVAAGTVSPWMSLPRVAAGTPGRPRTSGKARACILVYLLGGPPHLDIWDLKPDAPAGICGPYRPIATRSPGMMICEHLPRLALQSDKFSLLRAVSYPNDEHTSMTYYTLTGHFRERFGVEDTTAPRRTDFPHVGSAVARFRPPSRPVPGFVALPDLATRQNDFQKKAAIPIRGGRGGFLGASFDPLVIHQDPQASNAVPAMSLPAGVDSERFHARQALRSILDRAGPQSQTTRGFDEVQRLAVHLTGASSNGQGLYALEREPAPVRDRYGRHRFGQSLLLARRLVDAGVSMVAIHFNHMSRSDAWDMHGRGRGSTLDDLKTELLPLLDQGLSALLEDLDQRGLLAQTAVACMGEFGRTPRINDVAGRDHWGNCQTALLAGGGIQGGRIHGASDRIGAFPREGKADPTDIHATLYHCLGIDPGQEIHDLSNRPHQLCAGQVIESVL